MLAQITNPVLQGQLGNPGTAGGVTIGAIITAAVGYAFLIGALVFFFMLVWGAIEWIASGGDKQKLESARGRITSALIGIILLFAAFALIKVIQDFFGVKILTLDIGPIKIQ